jgi:hypothetical protein
VSEVSGITVETEPFAHRRFSRPLGAYNKEPTMAKDEHNKAAEHHENAAKAHRSAAEHHGKGDHVKGQEQAA